MASISVNASVSLSANGNTTSTGTVTWTAPSLPEGVTAWNDIIISGSYSWGGKGSVTVTINGSTCQADTAFNISLGRTATSPYSISCRGGNKNATGNNFTWNNLQVEYVYTPLVTEAFSFKQNGAWVQASAVYKKINGAWVLQTDLSSVIDTNKNYVKG